MIFSAPLPFRTALDSQEIRTLLQTTGRTADLMQLEPAILRRAFFSATVQNAEILDAMATAVSSFTAGQVDQATLRTQLREVIERTGYRSEPEQAGGLQDLASDARLNLILETNREMAEGFGHWQEGQDPDILDEWPAQELIRVIDSKVKRDWKARWIDAGGRFWDGPHRMIALKSDPIWKALSRFGTPWPPFDFNSGMDLADVSRDEAERIGLIEPGTQLFPQREDFNAELQASPAIRAGWLRGALEETGLGTFNRDGVFIFNHR